jgi:N-acylneuraminate cytidylyltransferase
MLDFAAKYNFDFIYLIQATSPLLTAENLDAGFDKMTSNNADSLLSVVEQKRFIWKSRGDFAAAQNYSPLARPRRQDFEGYLVENGAFYLTGRKQLLESSCRISGKIAVQLMSEETYYELDEDYDWNIIEAILYKRFIKKCDSLDNLSTVKLLVTDVDGVLTDSGMYYTADGDTMKKFSTRDGMGLRLLMESGLEVAIITGENSEIVARRAEKLKIQHVFRGIDDKITVLKNLCNELGITLKEVAYVGDDVNDLECISQVGFSACPADAHEKIMKLASLKLSKKGGEGCVRELCDLIMQANDK